MFRAVNYYFRAPNIQILFVGRGGTHTVRDRWYFGEGMHSAYTLGDQLTVRDLSCESETLMTRLYLGTDSRCTDRSSESMLVERPRVGVSTLTGI